MVSVHCAAIPGYLNKKLRFGSKELNRKLI